ncbi:sensor histidine kinase [Faecalimonas sp.]
MRLLMKEMRKKYLNRELFVLSLLSFGISIFVYVLLLFSSSYFITRYYNTAEHIEKLEKKYVEDLQNYITREKITVQSIGKIDDWVFDKEDVFLKIFVKGNIIYDAMYGQTDNIVDGIEKREHFGRMKNYELILGLEKAEVVLFCYDFSAENYAMYISLFTSFLVFFIVMVVGVRRKITYLVTIQKELNMLLEDLDCSVSLWGNDEITDVARGIDALRLSVKEKMEKEKMAYEANQRLIASLSHDIKTPLTTVIAYLELVKSGEYEDEKLRKYVGISLDKANHLKELTNELFEHFLLHGGEEQVIFEQVNGNELIMQLFEENLFDLEMQGADIRRDVSDITSTLEVNVRFVYRLFHNLFSNLEKYGDFSKPIFIRYAVENNYLVLSMQNTKAKKQDQRESAKIGLHNCAAIMEKHKGTFEVVENDNIFCIRLAFPIIKT